MRKQPTSKNIRSKAVLDDYKGLKISVKGLNKCEVESCLRVLVRSFNISSIAIRKSGVSHE